MWIHKTAGRSAGDEEPEEQEQDQNLHEFDDVARVRGAAPELLQFRGEDEVGIHDAPLPHGAC